MNPINYEESRIEGSINAFEDVASPLPEDVEIGESPCPSPEEARRYAAFLESMLDSMALEDEADLLQAA